MKLIILIYRWFIALFVMTISGSLSLILVLASFGYLRNFCVKYIIKYSSRFILSVMGFKGVYPDLNQLPKYPVLYTFNHNSYLDVFLLTGLGLTDVRIVLSENTLKFIPLVISAKASGTFFIPDTQKHERRINFFKRVTLFLKRRKLSVLASSEGVHEWSQGIDKFNKGVYHMAMEAELPIVGLYIHIPEENNLLRGNKMVSGGTIVLEVLGEFETASWKLENIRDHIEGVRAHYLKRFDELNPPEKIKE
jgi:1-acyl-sn-glycerol-3-phosphate acyltransferase